MDGCLDRNANIRICLFKFDFQKKTIK